MRDTSDDAQERLALARSARRRMNDMRFANAPRVLGRKRCFELRGILAKPHRREQDDFHVFGDARGSVARNLRISREINRF